MTNTTLMPNWTQLEDLTSGLRLQFTHRNHCDQHKNESSVVEKYSKEGEMINDPVIPIEQMSGHYLILI